MRLGHVVVPLAVVAFLALAAVAAEAAFAGRALPGLRVGDVAVGALDEADVRQRLEAQIARPWAEATVSVRYELGSWTATNADLGIAPDVDAAVAEALRFGKSGSPLARADAWLDAVTGRAAVPFVMRSQGEALERWVGDIDAYVDRPATDGELRRGAEGITVFEPVIGRELDRAALRSALLAARSLGDREIEPVVRLRHPAVDHAGIAEAAALVRAVTTPLEIKALDRTLTEDPVALSTLIQTELVEARPGELPALSAGASAPATRYRYVARLDEARIGRWVEALGAALDRPARNASYAVRADGSLEVIPGVDGMKVDREAMRVLARELLVEPADGGRRAISVPLAVDRPAFTTEQAERYRAEMKLVSSFETYFPYNASRWANIRIGAAQFNGLVIPPGGTFAFWDLLGPVTVERGYAYAGAIINNRSDDSVIGGGLCQVSTTIFNAIARAGYEIVERHEHSYYIERYPIGLDAAVFQPGADLRWRNDTPYPVLILSSSTSTSVTFRVLSVPTGRTVAFSAPFERNFTDVAPGQAADPAFPPGYVVKGRDVTRTRTVYEGGKVIHQDTFFSHYVPVWGGPARAQ